MSARSSADPIQIGVLFSQTGVAALVERTQMQAVLLAISEVNAAGGVRGRPIEPVVCDPASDPTTFRRLCVELMEGHGVDIIFGCYMSSTRKAVLPEIERRNGLLFYPTLYEGFEFSSSCIYSGAAPNQNSISLAKYLIEHYGDRFYLVGSNYIFPYESNRIIRDYIVSFGGEVVEERYVPLTAGRAEFDPIIEDVRRRPSVVISTVVGESTKHLYQAYRAAGLDPRETPIGSLTTAEPEVASMGAEAAAGHITSAPYFQSLDTPESRTFVARFQAMFGAEAPIGACAEAAYFQLRLFAKAAAQAGGAEVAAIRQALPGCDYLAPQGRVRVDPDNNHTYLWPRIGQVDPSGRFRIAEDARVPVKPDPYFVGPTDGGWSTDDPAPSREPSAFSPK